jgi:hypothetical protein
VRSCEMKIACHNKPFRCDPQKAFELTTRPASREKLKGGNGLNLSVLLVG